MATQTVSLVTDSHELVGARRGDSKIPPALGVWGETASHPRKLAGGLRKKSACRTEVMLRATFHRLSAATVSYTCRQLPAAAASRAE